MISVSPNTCSRFGAKRPVYPASASPGLGDLGIGQLPVETDVPSERLELERIVPTGEKIPQPKHHSCFACDGRLRRG